MKLFKNLFLLLACLQVQSFRAQQTTNGPDWIKDLVVYELSPKSFTSPHGPGTGTFNSLKEKVPYLHDLGINAVWLTGHNWADDKHFYNIWTQYACIRPDSIEPTLGTPEDFKILINEFHKYDIKVFLDVITHGVMSYSSLIKEKPHWFKGGSWGMTDFDWFGEHKDLDDWWVDTHVNYVTEYGVDGYRLDVHTYRPDLWKKIKGFAQKAGHQIAVFPENVEYTEDVSDFYQRISRLGVNTRMSLTEPHNDIEIMTNVASYYKKQVADWNKIGIAEVNVYYADETKDTGNLNGEGRLRIQTENLKQSDIKLTIKGLDSNKLIHKIELKTSKFNKNYAMESPSSPSNFPVSITGLSEISMILNLFSPDRIYLSNELSSHDRGWDGYPLDSNPYLARGSRCILGYSSLLTPSIPIFMSGEEFDADYVPLPWHSSHLFKKENIGTGRWLYASWLQWDQLSQKRHLEVLADVKKMLAIRKQEKDVIHSEINNKVPNIVALKYTSSKDVPVPYIMWNNEKAILVAGNNSDKDTRIKVTIPFGEIGMNNIRRVKISDLWNGGSKTLEVKGDTDFTFNIKKDKVAGGGIAVYRIEPVN